MNPASDGCLAKHPYNSKPQPYVVYLKFSTTDSITSTEFIVLPTVEPVLLP